VLFSLPVPPWLCLEVPLVQAPVSTSAVVTVAAPLYKTLLPLLITRATPQYQSPEHVPSSLSHSVPPRSPPLPQNAGFWDDVIFLVPPEDFEVAMERMRSRGYFPHVVASTDPLSPYVWSKLLGGGGNIRRY
jgi:hypothetical protein